MLRGVDPTPSGLGRLIAVTFLPVREASFCDLVPVGPARSSVLDDRAARRVDWNGVLGVAPLRSRTRSPCGTWRARSLGRPAFGGEGLHPACESSKLSLGPWSLRKDRARDVVHGELRLRVAFVVRALDLGPRDRIAEELADDLALATPYRPVVAAPRGVCELPDGIRRHARRIIDKRDAVLTEDTPDIGAR